MAVSQHAPQNASHVPFCRGRCEARNARPYRAMPPILARLAGHLHPDRLAPRAHHLPPPAPARAKILKDNARCPIEKGGYEGEHMISPTISPLPRRSFGSIRLIFSSPALSGLAPDKDGFQGIL